MRDFQRPEPCPECRSRNVLLLHATPATVYLACGACDHTWHIETLDPLRRRTSAAFRMTTRVVGSGRALASVA